MAPITAQTTKPKYPVSNLQTGNTTNTAQTIPQAQLAASSAIPFQSGITGKMADIGGKISNFFGSFNNKIQPINPTQQQMANAGAKISSFTNPQQTNLPLPGVQDANAKTVIPPVVTNNQGDISKVQGQIASVQQQIADKQKQLAGMQNKGNNLGDSDFDRSQESPPGLNSTPGVNGQSRTNPTTGAFESYSTATNSWNPAGAGGTTGAGNTDAQGNVINDMAGGGTLLNQAVKSLLNVGQGNSAVQQATKGVQDVQNEYANKVAEIEGAPIPLEFQQGQKGVVERLYASKLANAQTALQNALTGQGQQITGASAAGGLVSPIQVPYSNQIMYPTNLYGTPGSTTGGNSLVNSIPSLAQSVVNGQMTIDQANNMIGNTMGLTDQLRQAIQKLNPNFNFSLSSSSGATQAQGQQIKTQSDTAIQALDKLQTDFGNLSQFQTGGIPATNSIANWVAEKLGSGKLAEYQTTLADARAQLAGVLTATGAMTQSGAENMALTYLPDNMTPDMLTAKISAAKTLIQQKISSFTQSGQQGTGSTNAGQTGAEDYNW